MVGAGAHDLQARQPPSRRAHGSAHTGGGNGSSGHAGTWIGACDAEAGGHGPRNPAFGLQSRCPAGSFGG
eukprot:5972429-Prorocentrum_lima.AAC.1